MDQDSPACEPEWVARFLAALQTTGSSRAAARAAGVAGSTPYSRRRTHPGFRAAWDALLPLAPAPRKTRRSPGPPARRDATRIAQFLEELALTSNVAAAAAVAGLDSARIYRLRRSDPAFARRWYEALAEGYDNLEMELLQHLRGGDGGAGGKFDTAAALRCLAAHRDNVAREKGRRTLEAEVVTIATINAKIDALRLRAREGRAAIRKARAERAAQTGEQA